VLFFIRWKVESEEHNDAQKKQLLAKVRPQFETLVEGD